MSRQIFPRLGAASGILYVVLLFGTSLVGGDAAVRIELVGILFFVPFLACLWSVLREGEGDGGWLAATVFGAGLVDLAIKLGSAAPGLAAEQVKEGSPLDAALHDVNSASFILSMLPLAVLTAAFAIVTLKTRVLPRWLGWMGALTAAALLANGMFLEAEFGPAFLLFLLWTVATSVVLVRRAASGVRRASKIEPALAAPLVLLVLALAACGGNDEPASMTVELAGTNRSGQTGSATLTDAGQSGTTVVLRVSAPDRFSGNVQPAEVMGASCADLVRLQTLDERIAVVEHHLAEVRNGRSETTSARSLAELTSGGLSIAVFQQATPYEPVVCGDVRAP